MVSRPTAAEPLTLRLPYPPSVNAYWRSRTVWKAGVPMSATVYVGAAGLSYRARVSEELFIQRRGRQPAPLPGRLSVAIDVFPPIVPRVRDLDNICKALLDALTACGVWLDDSQIDLLTIRRRLPASSGCVEVRIGPYREDHE